MIGTTEDFLDFRREQQKSAAIAQEALRLGAELYTLRSNYTAQTAPKSRRLVRRANHKLGQNLAHLDEESIVGRRIFGTAPDGRRREFFNIAPNVWLWHEEEDVKINQTTRYHVDIKGVKKVRLGRENNYLRGQELENFGRATARYFELAKRYYEAK